MQYVSISEKHEQPCHPVMLARFTTSLLSSCNKEIVLWVKATPEDSPPYISFWSESFRTLIHPILWWRAVSSSPEMSQNVPNIWDHLDHIKWWFCLGAIMSKWLSLRGAFICLCFMPSSSLHQRTHWNNQTSWEHTGKNYVAWVKFGVTCFLLALLQTPGPSPLISI